jgi:hypothetical protein
LIKVLMIEVLRVRERRALRLRVYKVKKEVVEDQGAGDGRTMLQPGMELGTGHLV